MAFDLNKIQIIGRLGRDPEMKFTPQGTAITTFSVAVGGKWTDRDGNERGDETEWFQVDVWGPRDGGEYTGLAGQCDEYLAKGQQVYVEGRFKTEKWTDKNGVERTSIKIAATSVVFLGTRSERQGEQTDQPPAQQPRQPQPQQQRGSYRNAPRAAG